ncbi:MAG: extracellular solute-binding protein [Chloroflexi bacterium]|nr:extracellular solute-binding protein [Chloroflexota bacterium]
MPNTRLTRLQLLRASSGAFAAGVLAACGQTADGGQGEARTGSSKEPVSIEHLDWWVPSTPVLQTYFDGIKKDFEEKYPNVTVSYTFVKGTGGVREKWIALTAGGTPHDSSQVSVAFVRDLMTNNLIEPLDAYIAKTRHMDAKEFVDTGRFYNTYRGKQYGIPYDGPAENVIAYNTQHFKEVGLDPSRKFTWSWTYDQFLEAARKLAKTQGGKIIRGGFSPPGLSIGGFLPWLYANSGDFYDKDYKRILANDAKGKGALQYIVDLRHRHKLAAEVDGAALENEGYSMVVSGSWTVGYILDKNPDLPFAYTPIPKGPMGAHPSSQTWTNMWAMSRDGKKKDWAWQWLSFVNSEETQERYFAGVLKRHSGRKAYYQSAAWKQVLKEYPQLEGLEKIADMSKQYPWVKTAELNDETKDHWKKLQNNEISVNEMLLRLEQIGNRLLSSG